MTITCNIDATMVSRLFEVMRDDQKVSFQMLSFLHGRSRAARVSRQAGEAQTAQMVTRRSSGQPRGLAVVGMDDVDATPGGGDTLRAQQALKVSTFS